MVVAIINFSEYIKQLRLRKQMTLIKVAEDMGYHVVSISRMEAGNQMPKSGGILGGELAFSHLDTQNMEVLAMRSRLITALDRNETQEAEIILAEIESLPNFNTPINKQFILSQKARLMEQQDYSPKVIMPLVEDALRQTYGKSDIKLTDHTALIFEEAELFHTMARTYKRLGNLPEAIKILQSLECSISKLPTWDKDREKQQIPVLLTLAQCQLQAQQYEIAIQTCIRGFDYSATRSQGLYAPDFMYLQAQALFALQRDGYAPLLRNAYFCYTMLHKKEAEGLLREASDKMGVTINTYGVDALIYAPRVKATYERGALSNYKDIGEMLKSLRKKARLTLAELSKGICSIANLQKIESGAIQGKMKYIEPLMQRLGRDVHLYCPFYLKRNNFLNAQMKENIHMLQVTGDYNKANELVNILKKKDEFKKYIGLQFIKRVEALNYYAIQKKISPIYLNMLTDALKITCPQFNEQNIDQYSLTHDEIIIISAIATYYVDTSNNERAANIYKNLNP